MSRIHVGMKRCLSTESPALTFKHMILGARRACKSQNFLEGKIPQLRAMYGFLETRFSVLSR